MSLQTEKIANLFEHDHSKFYLNKQYSNFQQQIQDCVNFQDKTTSIQAYSDFQLIEKSIQRKKQKFSIDEKRSLIEQAEITIFSDQSIKTITEKRLKHKNKEISLKFGLKKTFLLFSNQKSKNLFHFFDQIKSFKNKEKKIKGFSKILEKVLFLNILKKKSCFFDNFIFVVSKTDGFIVLFKTLIKTTRSKKLLIKSEFFGEIYTLWKTIELFKKTQNPLKIYSLPICFNELLIQHEISQKMIIKNPQKDMKVLLLSQIIKNRIYKLTFKDNYRSFFYGIKTISIDHSKKLSSAKVLSQFIKSTSNGKLNFTFFLLKNLKNKIDSYLTFSKTLHLILQKSKYKILSLFFRQIIRQNNIQLHFSFNPFVETKLSQKELFRYCRILQILLETQILKVKKTSFISIKCVFIPKEIQRPEGKILYPKMFDLIKPVSPQRKKHPDIFFNFNVKSTNYASES